MSLVGTLCNAPTSYLIFGAILLILYSIDFLYYVANTISLKIEKLQNVKKCSFKRHDAINSCLESEYAPQCTFIRARSFTVNTVCM